VSPNKKASTPTERSAPPASRLAARRSAGPVLLVVAAVGGLWLIFSRASPSTVTARPGGTKTTAYQVGAPGIGAVAPGFALQSAGGATVDLAALRGRTVLLYFQEGLTCEPCWTQLKDLQLRSAEVRAAGIDEIVTITTDPVDLLRQKVADEGLSGTVLSDSSLRTSHAYSATGFGMMGGNRDGHSFVLVRPDGTISWRADYGGAPRFTMYVPVEQLLADLRAGRQA
jgi:peroxiredoxin